MYEFSLFNEQEGGKIMDKYQERLLRDTRATLLTDNYEENVELNGEKIVLKQSENYTLENYVLKVENPQIDYIVAITNKETKFVSKDNVVDIPFKINNLINLIKIYFKEDLADFCEFQVDFKFEDKEIWDAKVREENQKNLKELLSLTCRTGMNLLNIIWSNVSKQVEKSCLKIYAREKDKDILMLEKEFSSDTFFYALDNLAFGKYVVKMKQLGKNDELLVEDEHMVQIDNDIVDKLSALASSLNSGLSDVKNQVKASGRHIVCN